ncbi:hypothetical protein [Candidatus Manganitrophus noduliformans]|uniref:Uncharacterized protein n=1 Tax=Candidatus Manganitrophus noduliformans TaxID=2606439 RepID=A0A7X6DLX6_9BACT|nr:hypothetical protein [Candidatus Manganitrophus noduliformans]NKE69542.1 hypothetical protein [Candidatus Manganitrophus noduliformans]
MKKLSKRRKRKEPPYGGPIPDEEFPPDTPEEIGLEKRAALVLHCGGRAIAATKGSAVVFSENIITQHTDLMYLRLTASFFFGHDEITYLSPFFDRGPVERNVKESLLNRRGANARADGKKLRDGDLEVVDGSVVLDALNTLANVKAFFDRVRAEGHDEVFVYIHGHGNAAEEFRRNGRVVLADEDSNPSEFISFEQLGKWINAIQADHIGVAVDTCYSGQLARRIRNRRHLLVAMSADGQDLSFGDGENAYHKIRRGKFGDWSDLFIFNFQKLNADDKVDVATDRASRAVGSESLNATPRRAPSRLSGH